MFICVYLRPIFFVLFATLACAQSRQVAITIDDLPRGGDGGDRSLAATIKMTNKLLAPFRKRHIPVIGFLNEGRDGYTGQDAAKIAKLWLDAGAELGNHSHSHLNLNHVPLEEYESDILKGEPVLRAALNPRSKKLEFYRHPFLYKGPTPEKKIGLEAFLKDHGYREAPVTLDNSDYAFAAAYTKPEFTARVKEGYIPYMESIVAFFETRSIEIFGREIPQILLIHANQLNADKMPELLAMFERRGYRFVSLNDALKDEAYRSPDDYVGTGGFSWFHRWSKTKGMPGKGEPDPPAWLPQ